MAIGLLEVHLLKAKGLRGKDFLGKIDPYVIVKYKTQERKSSIASGEGGSPIWNEKVRFKVEYPGVGHDYKLILNLMDKDTFSTHDFLGQATVYVKDLIERGVENGTSELRIQKYNVVQSDQTYCGEIQVGVTFTKMEENNGGQEYGGWKQSYNY
ncbi:16 kDa phloem protein 1-like [Mercurialis annua]|uniref:16 kDa phloem protein 1-like n=1 Tax=Mercurialis annua TaxID=3986 RepID=UPI00215E3413|nr:16 kDa phloem protein 1-like [Mercurialis annua]